MRTLRLLRPAGARADRGVAGGRRFAFGSNWRQFVAGVDESRVTAAERSLQSMLGVGDLQRLTFLDVGSGSGLFSLAAWRLGAEVTSFDSDDESVAATEELRRRFGGNGPGWRVLHGSVLDRRFLESLGAFDVVYAWGVLHHTGNLWEGVGNVAPLVKPGGRLFVAIYNDQGRRSERWRAVKQRYVSSGALVRGALVAGLWLVLHRRAPLDIVRRIRRRDGPAGDRLPPARGMSSWHDLIDWVGGFPFEVAGPDAVFMFLRERGFVLDVLVTNPGSGCNEFVFTRSPTGGALLPSAPP